MKIFPLIIASAFLLLSCDKKETSKLEAVTNPVTDSVNVAGSTLSVNTETTADPLPTDASAAKTSSVRPALNPEHGQPYHRCDIQVGAPIDSAPQQNAAPQPITQNTTSAGFNTNPIAPSSTPSVAPVTATGPKPALNPAHGEPHHRCDLQVGDPLI